MHTNNSTHSLRRSRLRSFSIGLLLVSGVAVFGCDRIADAAESTETKTVAKVGDRTVSRADLMQKAEAQLEGVELERVQCIANVEKKRYDVLEAHLEGLVREQLRELAAADAGKPTSEWLNDERAERVTAVPDAEVDRLISQNPRLARANREQIEGQVRSYLAEEALYDELKQRFDVAYELEPYRVEVAADGPAKGGPESAPVTIVEFSDFQCPYCKRVLPALDQAVEQYGDKVRLVFRQFPLNSIHPEAQKAAEASLCAHDQGKFWEMHDALFEDQKKLSIADMKQTAERLELDVEEFTECVESGTYADEVGADLRAGAQLGVSGTPALFVNGRPMAGAVAFEALAEVIDEELEKSN